MIQNIPFEPIPFALELLAMPSDPHDPIRNAPERLPYRGDLFREFQSLYQKAPDHCFLEIGPKDGEDSRRLAGLNPREFYMIDLPEKGAASMGWRQEVKGTYISENFLYWDGFTALPRFAVIWCTGVLYHNAEQLRFLRRLYRQLDKGGWLILESATARRPENQDQAVVEIYYPERYRDTLSVTHIPSKAAVEAWLGMVGFRDVSRSACYDRLCPDLKPHRGAWICRKGEKDEGDIYYSAANGSYCFGDSL
jgi:SAM-dependent methyltransferase